MNERYVRLYNLPGMLYIAGSPVIIEAGALLKDNQYCIVLAQLKIKNISKQIIKALTVKISAFDPAMRPLGVPVTFQYLDLNAKRNDNFGQNIPVNLPDTGTRAFHVTVQEVIFENNEVWSSEEEVWQSFSSAISLGEFFKDNELVKQFKIRYGEDCIICPVQLADLWYCACGKINHSDELECHSCGKKAFDLFHADLVSLSRERDIRLQKEAWEKHVAKQKAEVDRKDGIYSTAVRYANSGGIDGLRSAIREFKSVSGWKDADQMAIECEKRLNTLEEKKNTRNRKIRFIIGIAFIIVLAILLTTNLIIPSAKYDKALAMMKSGQYENAVIAFDALSGFSDSIQKKAECEELIIKQKYEVAKQAMYDGNYEAAIGIFEKLNGYGYSGQYIEDCKTAIIEQEKAAAVAQMEKEYVDAIAQMENGEYEKAIVVFEKLDGYKESEKFINECNKGIDYNTAVSLIQNNNIREAYPMLWLLGDFKDSSSLRESIYGQYCSNLYFGDSYFFGNYEQDNNSSNGKEPIEWLILDKVDNSILIISKFGLDCKQYNSLYTSLTWDTSDLRRWLNDEFLKTAFNDEEQGSILNTTVSTIGNPYYGTDGGPDTNDRVFLIDMYKWVGMAGSDVLKASPTDYAKSQGASMGIWWLRSPGKYKNFAVIVNSDGSIDPAGRSVISNHIMVRPALWIHL